MNAFNKNSLWQKMFKCAAMIIILLQTACAVKVTKLGDAQEVSTQPIAQSDAPNGARIVLLLHNQQEIAGRLLSVRDSSLVISTNEEQDHHIDAQIADILVVENKYIQRVIIKGKSRVLKGMGLGLQSGAGIGFASDDDSPDSRSWQLTPEEKAKAVVAKILFGGAGMIIGGIVGAAASKADKAIDPAMNHDFSALKPLAQFPEKEPEYLSAVK
jgi:hypothetical protein